MTAKYNSWPLGKLPKELQRPELDQLREAGYKWDDPRDAISMFEDKVAKFAGSKFGVAVDCCSHGLFLALKWLVESGKSKSYEIMIPKRTYVSVPMQIQFAGFKPVFKDIEWSGIYKLEPEPVYDGAVRWKKGMFEGGFQVVSFQLKKRVPIGRGGMILTDDEEAYKWLKLASYDGRDLNLPYMDENHVKCLGYHYYMTPEDAARGILLMDQVPEDNEDSGCHENYSDVSQIWKKVYAKK
jgi:dTDP-4-amino-4,6-dideoxygalactose transaminase